MRHRLSVRASALLVLVALAASAAVGTAGVSASAPAGVTKAADLFAGKTTDVGDVFVWHDLTNLYVEIDITAADWCMSESHVAAATTLAGIPQTNGNSIPGQFAYGDSYSPCVTEDTFTIPLVGLGTNPYVAVHAKVLHETSMWVYSDDGNTTVTATTALPLGKVLPFSSSDAWEPYADTDPSVWDTGVGVGTFQFADWIWQSYRVQTPTVDEVVTFQRAFTVPGPVAPGSWMKVTTDDAYTASLNGTPVASDTWPNWPTVENASPFNPVMGANTLVFVATNSDDSLGLSGTIDSNPGGLIYEAKIFYYDRIESAWAGTAEGISPFPGKNWATYFQFNVQTLTVLTGDLWMGDEAIGGVPDQHLTFSVVDAPDGGVYGYVNIDAVDVDYAGAPSCVDYDAGTPNILRFAYQIPAGEGALTGLWIVWRVGGGATPTAGFSVAPDGPGATAMCNDGSFVPANGYPVYTFTLNF